MKDIKQIKKKHGLTDADIAEMFGYKNAPAYYYCSRKSRIEAAITTLYNTGDDTEMKKVFGWLDVERGCEQVKRLRGLNRPTTDVQERLIEEEEA